MTDSAGVSNLNPQASDPLASAMPSLGSIATTIRTLVEKGLSIDEAAEKVAKWIDPAILPALQTLATVLQAVERFLPAAAADAE